MIPAVEAAGGEIVDCHVLVDRSGGLTHVDLADERPGLSAERAVDAGPADLRARPGDLSRCAAGEPLHAPGSTGTGGRGVIRRLPGVVAVALLARRSSSPAARPPTGRRRRRSRRRRASRAHRVPPASLDVPGSPIVGVVTHVDSDGPRPRSRASPCGRPRPGPHVRDRHARERRRVPAGPPDGAHGGGRPGPASTSGRRTASSCVYRLEDAP